VAESCVTEARVEAPPVTVELVWMPQLVWPSLGAGVPFVRELRLTGLRAGRPVEVSLAVEYQGHPIGRSATRLTVRDQGSVTIADPSWVWRFDNSPLFLDQVAPVPASLEVVVTTEGPQHIDRRVLGTMPVEILSPKQWDSGIRLTGMGRCELVHRYRYLSGSVSTGSVASAAECDLEITGDLARRMAASVAALCLPQHSATKNLCALVEEKIHGTEGTQANPIELKRHRGGRETLFKVLHTQLRQRFSYAIEDVSFAGPTQRVRLPDEREREPLPRLTCIDLALLAAAALEQWELDPVIVLAAKGAAVHAMAAIPVATPLEGEKHPLPVTVASGELPASLLAVDLTAGRDLQEARSLARTAIERADLYVAVDIAACRRAACLPLPLHADSVSGNMVFRRRYCQEAPEAVSVYTLDEGDRVGPAEIFVPILGAIDGRDGGGPVDGLELLTQRAPAPRKVAILANSGAGKSYLLGRLFLDHLAQYCKSSGEQRLPVFFSLSRFIGKVPFALQLREWLNAHGYPSRSVAAFQEELEAGRFTFYLDGLDEMKLRVGAGVEDLLAPLLPVLSLSNAEIVLTGRSAMFGSKAATCLPDYDVLRLHPWKPNSWHIFLARYQERGHITVEEAKGLRDLKGPMGTLITKPLYCKMIVEEREQVLRNDVRNEADLFRRYVSRFWRHRPVATEFLTSSEEKNQCMQEIAYRMEHDNRLVWSIADLSNYINRDKAHLASLDEWKKYLTEIRVYSFLDASAKNQDEFAFSHEAFREYFLAEHIVARMIENDLRPISDIRISQEVARIVADVLTLQTERPVDLAAFATGPLTKHTERPRNLALVEIARSKRCPSWPLEGADFSALALAGTDFSGSKLNGALFLNSDLTNCRFDGAELKNAKFLYSKVEGASFRSAVIDRRQLEQVEGRPIWGHG
jgi:hypothetical protein